MWWVSFCDLPLSLCDQKQITDLAEVLGPEGDLSFRVSGGGRSLWALWALSQGDQRP